MGPDILCDFHHRGDFGFGGVSAGAADIARILFYIFLVIFIVLLVLGLVLARRL